MGDVTKVDVLVIGAGGLHLLVSEFTADVNTFQVSREYL